MKAVIFAGGVGTRLWPLSRRHSPKQFEQVIGDKSTLQLSLERLVPDFAWKDIFISTNVKYIAQVKDQLPDLPETNIIAEPESRDVGPSVALLTSILSKNYHNQPIVILWSDHIIKKIELFKRILTLTKDYIHKNNHKIIFISQKARFASQNLGWVKFGKTLFKKNGIAFYKFAGFHYRASLDQASNYYNDGSFAWNTGYFVTTPSFLWSLYQKYQPEIYKVMKKLKSSYEHKDFPKILSKIYPNLPKISFDNAILEKIESGEALVVVQDLGWSDVGAWEALKEALQTAKDKNVVKGKVVVTDCQDSLIYNYTDQLVVTIDLDGHLVVNTNDVVLVCHKNSVPKIKKLVENLSKSENEHLV